MSIDDLVSRKGPRVLCIDLERIPGRVTLDIFDAKQRSDYIHASTWQEYPETLCFAWRWLGERTTHFAATWTTDDLAALSWRLYDEATHVLTFNGHKADNKWCRDDWLLAGLPKPAPWRDIDLYVVLRNQFALEARSLDFACQRLGLPGKRGHYNVAQARAAAEGDPAAQRAIERYNRGDVKATLDLWERVRGLVHVPGLNLGLQYLDAEDVNRCPTCGKAGTLKADGWYTAAVQIYGLLRCSSCGGLARNNHVKSKSRVRGV